MKSRESIYAALFALGQLAYFKTSSRRIAHVAEVDPSAFPAFYQTQTQEDWATVSGNLPPLGTLRVEWWVYVYGTDPTISHGQMLNPLVDALLATLKLPPAFSGTGTQSLGGLIISVQLDGPIHYVEGALADRGFARIPLVIKTPG